MAGKFQGELQQSINGLFKPGWYFFSMAAMQSGGNGTLELQRIS